MIGVCAAFQVVADTREMSSPALKVRVDTAFPRVVDYQWKANGATLYGQDGSAPRGRHQRHQLHAQGALQRPGQGLP